MKKSSELNVREIEKKIGYTFKDKSLITQAFTRTSYCNEINSTQKVKYHSNEVLEFFGDGVLSLSIITFLLKECTERYEHGIKTELNEGDFSNIKSKLSDKQNLSKSMKALGLEKHLLMGEGDAKLGIQNEPSVMEDLFESIVGAIFIDSGMNIQAVIDAVSGMLDMSVYTKREKISQSAKNALQEWCADKKRRLPAPRYETLSEDGPDHKKTYMRACYIGDKLMGRGIGKNFKLADAAAAEDALQALMAKEGQHSTTKIDNSEVKPVKSAKNTQQGAAKKTSSQAANSTEPKPEADGKKTLKYNASYSTLLKKYVEENKLPSPVFKDLGERKLGAKIECAVECSLSSHTAIGTGKTRTEARENACMLIIQELSEVKRSSSPEVAKTAAKKPGTNSAPANSGKGKSNYKKGGASKPRKHTAK